MIDIKIDIVPLGDEDLRNNFDTIKIVNTMDHPDRPLWGNYDVTIGQDFRSKEKFRIENHYRDDGYWSLLGKIISKYRGEK